MAVEALRLGVSDRTVFVLVGLVVAAIAAWTLFPRKMKPGEWHYIDARGRPVQPLEVKLPPVAAIKEPAACVSDYTRMLAAARAAGSFQVAGYLDNRGMSVPFIFRSTPARDAHLIFGQGPGSYEIVVKGGEGWRKRDGNWRPLQGARAEISKVLSETMMLDPHPGAKFSCFGSGGSFFNERITYAVAPRDSQLYQEIFIYLDSKTRKPIGFDLDGRRLIAFSYGDNIRIEKPVSGS